MRRYNTTLEIKAEILGLLQERMARIDVDQEKYIVAEQNDGIIVCYDGIRILNVTPFISNVVVNGQRQVSGMFSLRVVHDDYWYDNDDLDTDVFVDEYLECQFQNQRMTFDKLLDVLMPLAKDDKVKIIYEALDNIGFKDASVKFDTFTYKYVVEGDIYSSCMRLKIKVRHLMIIGRSDSLNTCRSIRILKY